MARAPLTGGAQADQNGIKERPASNKFSLESTAAPIPGKGDDPMARGGISPAAESPVTPPSLSDLTPPNTQARIPRAEKARTGSIIGVLRSVEGAGLGDSRIILRRTSTTPNSARGNEPLQAITKGDGWFGLRDVPPGTYTLSVSVDGFETLTQENLSMKPGDELAMELSLRPLEAAPKPLLLPHSGVEADSTGPQTAELETSLRLIPRPEPEAITRAEPVEEDQEVFVTDGNRWKDRYPEFRRYVGSGEFQFVKGHWFDPFNNNRLKGDYPVLGSRTFLTLSAVSESLNESRRLPFPPAAAAPLTSLSQNQYWMAQNFTFSADLFGGDAAYRPADWRIRVTPAIGLNYASVGKPGILDFTNPELTRFATRAGGLQEAFAEVKLKDLSDAYDAVSLRAGIQNFNSDFRGFIFSNSAPGVRLYGNLGSNRYQYNLAVFDVLVKDVNSGLNTLEFRKQQVYVANLYRQDFLKRGYTIEVSAHYDKDDPSTAVNANNFQVRPVPIGPSIPHAVRAYYLGFAGDGHLGRVNVTHAFYEALGHDTYNAIAARAVNVNAQMAALELSLDRDWIRYRASLFYASGDRNPREGAAHGFDAILDNPNFAGGMFSFWNREILNFSDSGVALTNGSSLIPDIRSGKTSGQANFVNPGVLLANGGADLDITPRLRGIMNLNMIRFANTQPLELLLNQSNIHAGIGADLGFGARYRPALNDNVVVVVGFSTLFPGAGLRQIYSGGPFYSLFTLVRFRY